MSIQTKAEKIMKVAEVVFKVLIAKGITSLSYTQIARDAKVSRAWLYKYVGNSREDLLALATDIFGRMYSDLDRTLSTQSPESWIQEQVNGLEKGLMEADQFPWIIPAYYRYRGAQNVLGERIDVIESQYVQKNAADIVKVFCAHNEAARAFSEYVLVSKMALAHKWVSTPAQKRHDIKSVLKYYQMTLQAMSSVALQNTLR